MRLLLGQIDIVWEDIPANIVRVENALQRLQPKPGTWVILPEMWATGFSMDPSRTCAGAESAVLEAQSAWARRWGIRIIGGVACPYAGRPANQAVGVTPEGGEWFRFSKLHGFSLAGEPAVYAPGSAVVVAEADGARVCPLICYDLRFPESFRAGVGLGADVFVVIANWPARRERHWLALLTARAIENQAWVVGVNRVGQDPSATYSGRSVVIDPTGVVRADAGEGERWLEFDLDPGEAARWRHDFPALRDR